MTTKQTVEIFRCDAKFREQLANCAQTMDLDKSSYIRYAVATVNRMVMAEFNKEPIECSQ